METKKINIDAEWDSQAHVWTATSNDLPGLVVEAKNCDELVEELRHLVPELLSLNGNGVKPGSLPIEIRSHLEFEYA